MTKLKLLLLIAFVICSFRSSFAQPCNCGAAFNWAKKAFEENDAGFKYILEQKGSEAYEIHNAVFEKRTKKITLADSCVKAIKQWSKFFRVGHFNFIVNKDETSRSINLASKKESVQRNAGDEASRYTPVFQSYDSNTVYLRIPTFMSDYKKQIDSVIHANQTRISSTKNLIIDIRDNGGGDDASFYELLPILYTNPIREITVERLSTPNNNKIWVELMNKPGVSENYKMWYKRYLDTMNANLGKFIRLNDRDVFTRTYSKTQPFPQNVGILINGKNGSTAEQFLLAAKQSKKVKLFGTTTMGELDISNMYSITSPDKKYTLWYCTSKSLRVPENTIDNKGIAPDFYIDRSIPAGEWLTFVAGILHHW